MTLNAHERHLLATNPAFYPARIQVIVEPSEVGLTVWDKEGRHIVIEPHQFEPLNDDEWLEEVNRALYRYDHEDGFGVRELAAYLSKSRN